MVIEFTFTFSIKFTKFFLKIQIKKRKEEFFALLSFNFIVGYD